MTTETFLRLGEKLRLGNLLSRYQLRQALVLQNQCHRPLGRVLTGLGYLSQSQLDAMVLTTHQKPFVNEQRLGELLLSKGWVTPAQLDLALLEQKQTEEELGLLLVRHGCLSPDRLEVALVEQLLLSKPTYRRRLGEILVQTCQLSGWQLGCVLQYKSTPRKLDERLGSLLLRFNLLSGSQLEQALRLQRRLLRASVIALLGGTLLIACKAPTVPMQIPYAGNMQVAASQPQASVILGGAFKTLAIADNDNHEVNLRVYKNGSRILENVPYATQGNDNTCGQAVITMTANFWGVDTDYQSIVNRENPLNLATTATMIVSSLRKKGLSAQDFRDATLANLVAEINKGRPVIVLLDFGSIQTAHYVVVVGYNRERGTLIVHDSLGSAYAEMPQQNFLKLWENRAIRSILPVGGANYRRLMITVSHPSSP